MPRNTYSLNKINTKKMRKHNYIMNNKSERI